MNVQITPAASTEIDSVTVNFHDQDNIYIQEKLTLTLADETEFSPLTNQGTQSGNPLSPDDTTFINAVKTALDVWRKAKGI